VKFLLGIAAALLISTPSYAMKYSWRVSHGQVVAMASGDIEKNEGDIFNTWYQTLSEKISSIELDSTGGHVVGGFALGKIVHDLHLNTGIAKNGSCNSACVMVWAAGEHKSLPYDGSIGVHNCDAPNPTDAEICTLHMAQFLSANGAPPNVVVQVINTPNDDVYWLKLADFLAWKAKITR
jgi:hypothetical protein